MTTTNLNTGVVVVGGSLVGLSAAMLLAAKGVPFVLIEKHVSSSPHPRAIGFTTRTQEIFRTAGVGDRIPHSKGGRPRRIEVESLAGSWGQEKFWHTGGNDKPGQDKTGSDKKPGPPEQAKRPQDSAFSATNYSPCEPKAIAQDHLEPVLRERARESGADLRLGQTMTSFSQDSDGVNVTTVDQHGNETTITAKYLLACDGARSSVREALNISTSGIGTLRTLRSILFRCAPIEKYMAHDVSQFSIKHEGFEAFLVTYRDQRWALMWNDESGATISEDAAKERILEAIGDRDVTLKDIEIITQGSWTLSGKVADTFQSGRVFLAGDAAHALPPNPDVHNLVWRLDYVLRGLSEASLLEAYTTERHGVAKLRHDQIFLREDYKDYVRDTKWRAPEDASSAQIYGDVEMELGQRYVSQDIIDTEDSRGLPVVQLPEEWKGQPGTRAQHIWLQQDGKKVSTLDHFGPGWTLLSESEQWGNDLEKARKGLGWDQKDLKFLHMDAKTIPNGESFRAAYDCGTTGASLVRPDGFITWRTRERSSNTVSELMQVLHKAGHR
ncbi:hypothetical protein ANO11243_075650 [Dothideomycetidae sp. 11243]|nr:hypothetical protein ANO11243_075650 [fungal sp. No.11243]